MSKQESRTPWQRAVVLARSVSHLSIALLERHLGCGYSEAARLMERLRARGLA